MIKSINLHGDSIMKIHYLYIHVSLKYVQNIQFRIS